MNRDTKDIVIVVGIAFILIVVAVVALMNYSGMGSPLTVVESNSMQHSTDRSSLGVIDTGDMIVMVSPDKTSVTTFVEGSKTGYSKFGSYGDVIIYKRANGQNPVIHRAIIELIYNNDGTWSAPSLNGYEGGWDNNGNKDYMHMSGTFSMQGLGWRGLSAYIDLDTLPKHSGYLTNGDNNIASETRTYFDQSTTIAGDLGPIQKKDIKAVAGLEIPWLGCIKLYMNGKNINMIPGNSIPCLTVAVIDVVFLFIVLSIILSFIFGSSERRHREKGE